MKTSFSEKARRELDGMTHNLQIIFIKHVEKIGEMHPRRHLKHGYPYYVEEVGGQGRIVYQLEGGEILIGHCFTDHKEYERWYKKL
jgi:hypothetical protein